MKKFIISVLCIAVFFIGLGSLVQETGARFKSDERALDLVKQAQTAIGGEAAVKNVKSLTIKGTLAKTFDFGGEMRTEQGDVEINLQLPNQLNRVMKLRRENGENGENTEIKKEINVVVMERGDGTAPKIRQLEPNAPKTGVFVVKKGDADKVLVNENIDGTKIKKVITNENVDVLRGVGAHQNEMFRTTLALLLTAPQGADVSFTYVGDGDVDGNSCDVIEARTGESAVKLFLDKSSHLPRMMSYQGFKPMVFKVTKDDVNAVRETRTFRTNLDKPETAEFQIRFSDYRAVGGVLLPHQWTQTIAGNADETVNITNYEINPANIAEKFQNEPTRVLIRTERKPQ